jgi:hypothetical protein
LGARNPNVLSWSSRTITGTVRIFVCEAVIAFSFR